MLVLVGIGISFDLVRGLSRGGNLGLESELRVGERGLNAEHGGEGPIGRSYWVGWGV